MIDAADTSLGHWVERLAERQPTPGGGAAAAAAAAIGSAAAAMAAIYTTGKRWADRADRAQALADQLAALAATCIALADDDQQAYQALQETWKTNDLEAEEINRRQERALAIPCTLLTTCLTACEACADFLADCNPQIRSDLQVGIHLLAGAARAAWQTFLVNQPEAALRQEMRACLDRIAAIDADALDRS